MMVFLSLGYHSGLSGLICRAFSQPRSYKETSSFRLYGDNMSMKKFHEDTSKIPFIKNYNFLRFQVYIPFVLQFTRS